MPPVSQDLRVKLQVRLPPNLKARLDQACRDWAPTGTTYTPSDVVRLVLEERLPTLTALPPTTEKVT
jgi:hypothetical protein